MARRKVMAVIGSGDELAAEVEILARELGRLAIHAGFRVASGGLGGVMEAVSRGAHESDRWVEGDVLGVLPSYESKSANRFVDVAVPTGMGVARNVILVAMADVVVAIGGCAGTLGEMAMAWQLGRPLVALAVEGWSGRLAGEAIDARRSDVIARAATAAQAVAEAQRLLGISRSQPG